MWGPLRPHPHPPRPLKNPRVTVAQGFTVGQDTSLPPLPASGSTLLALVVEAFKIIWGSTEAYFLGSLEIRYRKSLGSGKDQAWSCQGHGQAAWAGGRAESQRTLKSPFPLPATPHPNHHHISAVD